MLRLNLAFVINHLISTFFLHRSNFIEYDWYNPNFVNQKFNTLEFVFNHPFWGNFKGKYELINNYTFFQKLIAY